MSRYFIRTVNTTGLAIRIVESSDADDLQRRVRAALDELETATNGGNLLVCNLAGEGDGPNYTVELIAVPLNTATPTSVVYMAGGAVPVQEPLSLVGLTATCYMAQEPGSILLQRSRALADSGIVATTPLYDELQAGGSKGLRVMGLLLHQETGP
jgi:hypothetical protein